MVPAHVMAMLDVLVHITGELIMKTRITKKLTLGALLILATSSMDVVFADGGQPFKIRFAGAFVQNILQAQLGPTGAPGDMVDRRTIALGKGVGTFGRVDVMAVAFDGPPLSLQACPEGFDKIADIVENNLLITFRDLSQLHGNGAGVLCLDPNNLAAPPVAEIDGTWNGGTGRFRNAGGTWSFRMETAVPVGVATQFVAETAVITGHVTGLHDD